jgi:hypothetical protein
VSVTLVLDTTAAAAYSRQSIAVGELIGMIADDHDTTVLPAVCLAEAAARATDDELAMLNVLAGLPGVAVTPFESSTAIAIGIHAAVAGSLGLATAAREAVLFDAQLATVDVEAARKALPDDWTVVKI